MTTETLEQYKAEMSRKRRIIQQARAILQRAKDAGIPPNEMKIGEKVFRSLMDQNYFSNKGLNSKMVDKMCHDIFNVPNYLFRRPFILVDGGNMYLRKRACFALLFRMIAWDRMGMYKSCDNTVHMLQSIKSTGDMSRNEYANELKSFDVLYLSECTSKSFNPHFESGSFFDEIFEARESNGKPTIVSFVNPIPMKGVESAERNSDTATGQYMMMFSESDSGMDFDNILRIRVKSNG